MALLTRDELVSALGRLGELANAQGEAVELLLVGGALMVLEFQARESTRDVDVVIVSPQDASAVRRLAKAVADERGWEADWLNDAAKGFVTTVDPSAVVFSAPGIKVQRPTFEQLLAMKLCAWRDDVDIADARRLLTAITGGRDEIWQRVEGFLQPGRELTARYAFDDLWEQTHGSD